MRTLVTFALILGLSVPALALHALALDLGVQRPAKPPTTYPPNVPLAGRQGGDTIADAVAITVPFSDTGVTVGFNDDYDEACPYTGSTSPDVVYSMIIESDFVVTIDLIGSSYDTKLYVYDENLELVACNDDYYPDDVSRLSNVPVDGGVEYFIVIDGYGGAAGEYMITVNEYYDCQLVCPAGADLEGEPPLVDGYVDEYNSGCGAPVGTPMQAIGNNLFCGVSGWYLSAEGIQSRDTDWFTVTIPDGGALEIVADAELPLYVFELGPQDCDQVEVLQIMEVGPCMPGDLVITGDPGDSAWIWVGPTIFEGPIGEFDYQLATNLIVATEGHSLSAVKALFH